jgi:hypothetical protein
MIRNFLWNSSRVLGVRRCVLRSDTPHKNRGANSVQKDLTQDLRPPWKMTQNVIQKYGFQGLVIKREIRNNPDIKYSSPVHAKNFSNDYSHKACPAP